MDPQITTTVGADSGGAVRCTDWLGRIVCGDNTEVLSGFPAECVDLVVTSPPYDDLRTYGGHSWNFETLAAQLVRVLKPGGVIGELKTQVRAKVEHFIIEEPTAANA